MKARSRVPVVLFVVATIAVAGCSDPTGPLDSRLYGKWESRRGFVATDTIDFHDDGTVKVTSFDGEKKKAYTARWYVKEKGQEQIKINMQAKGKSEFRTRSVKFHDDGSFEMTEGGQILGRFERKG